LGSAKVPAEPLFTVRLAPISGAVAVTVAPGITAPVVSWTDPKMVPDVSCAETVVMLPLKSSSAVGIVSIADKANCLATENIL
jgi:hypothetical protein